MTEPSVLIIDDDSDTRFLYGELLSSEGYRVVEAQDANAALKKLEQDPNIDLIILDLTLPGMSPQEFMEQKNQAASTKAIPVMTVSGRSDAHEQSKKMGAVDSLTKPFELDAMINKIKTLTSLSGSNLTH